MKKTLSRIIIAGIVALAGLGLLIQLVPYGKNHTNPPVSGEPAWDSPETRALAQRACFDCHSNETVWPWYSNVAPVSWLVYRDVMEGREKLNFSEWGVSRQEDLNEIIEVIREGEMPMPIYLIQHPEARLSAEEQQALIAGLQSSLK